MTAPRPVVVKVGGSLLDWPEFPARLTAYLNQRANDRLLLIVGGGQAADVIRRLDEIHALGEAQAHALALRSLDLTAQILAALVPGLEVVAHPKALDSVWDAGLTPILAPRLMLDDDDRTGVDPLPHSWSVTTDAVAARVAVLLNASELVLLKSAPLPPGADMAEATKLGLIDPAFPVAARPLERVLYLDFRDQT
ncbi:MAG: uridylate kinase [Isosphaeraceae bacterium]